MYFSDQGENTDCLRLFQLAHGNRKPHTLGQAAVACLNFHKALTNMPRRYAA